MIAQGVLQHPREGVHAVEDGEIAGTPAVVADVFSHSRGDMLGLVELRLGHWPQARDWSRRAVERQRELPRAWNNFGVALWQLGEKEKALDAWQQAVDFDPRLWDALWNLGLKAAELGKTAQARKALERFAAGAPPRYGEDVAKAREMLRRWGS